MIARDWNDDDIGDDDDDNRKGFGSGEYIPVSEQWTMSFTLSFAGGKGLEDNGRVIVLKGGRLGASKKPFIRKSKQRQAMALS